MPRSWPSPARRGRRYSSPPPRVWSSGKHWPYDWFKTLFASGLQVLEGTYNDTSLLHRTLLSQSLVALVAIRLYAPNPAEPLLAVVLLALQIGLVADRISHITLQLIRLSATDKLLDCLLNKTPLVTVTSTELALSVLLLRDGNAASADGLLMGCAYAKPLAIGASLLLACSLGSSDDAADRRAIVQPAPFWLLGSGGVLVLAAAPYVESEHRWVSQGVPLLLILHLGFTYSFSKWRHDEIEGRVVKADRTEADSSEPDESRCDWIALLAFLLVLRGVAVVLVRNLSKHLHSPAFTSSTNITLINRIVLPLLVSALDHSTNIALVFSERFGESWANIIQSTLTTYFFNRPLAALAGHDVDPTSGRLAYGLCLFVMAVWLSAPGVHRAVKALGLLVAYGYFAYAWTI